MGATSSRLVPAAVLDVAGKGWNTEVKAVHEAVVQARTVTGAGDEERPWVTLHRVQPRVMALLHATSTAIPSVSSDEEAAAALRAALACLEWGSAMVDTKAMLLSIDVINTIKALGKFKTGTDADVERRITSRQAYCENFHAAATLLCSLGYAVTDAAKTAAVEMPNVRWHVAKILTGAHSKDLVTLPNHVQFHEVLDGDFVTRAFVCVAYDLVPTEAAAAGDAGDTAGRPALTDKERSDPLELAKRLGRQSGRAKEPSLELSLCRRSFDVMKDEAPEGYCWEAKNALVVFTGTETPDLFYRKHIWLGGSIFGKWGVQLTEEADGIAGRGHGAWRAMAQFMKPAIEKALQDKRGSTAYLNSGSVWVLGHSLGAGLATLTVPYISALATTPPRIYLTTLASPRVFDEEGRDAFSSLRNVRIQRFVLREDAVPAMPPRWAGFRHVGYARTLRTPSIVSELWDVPNGPRSMLLSHMGISYRRPFEEFSGADVFAAGAEETRV